MYFEGKPWKTQVQPSLIPGAASGLFLTRSVITGEVIIIKTDTIRHRPKQHQHKHQKLNNNINLCTRLLLSTPASSSTVSQVFELLTEGSSAMMQNMKGDCSWSYWWLQCLWPGTCTTLRWTCLARRRTCASTSPPTWATMSPCESGWPEQDAS